MTLQNLSQITTPYGLLDEGTKDALVAAWEAGCKLESFNGPYWLHVGYPNWRDRTVYRVKAEPVRRTLYRDFGIAGRHVISCNADGTEPTVTWEPAP